MKKELYWLLLFCLALLSMLGCGSTSNAPATQPIGSDIIQKYNFHVVGEPTTTSSTLPQQFTDLPWALINAVCQRAGYDLTQYAGHDISLIKYDMTEKYNGYDSLSLIVLAKDQTSIGGYVLASNLTPGVIALNDPNIK